MATNARIATTMLLLCVAGAALGGVCSPRMGEVNHAPMAIDMTAGWWYVTCNARIVSTGAPVGLFYVLFESYLQAYGFDLLRTDAVITLPKAHSGERVLKFSQAKIVPESAMPWGVLPLDMSFPNSSLAGDADSWDIEASGATSANKKFGFELHVRNGEKSFRMTHANNTGCFNYNSAGMDDVFYQSSVGQVLRNDSWVRIPGHSKKQRIEGTCHYDRQGNLALTSTAQWTWGQATFGDNLPAGFEALSGSHLIFGGLYSDSALTQLVTTHVGIKKNGGALIEYDGLAAVNITAPSSYTDPTTNVSFYSKLCVEIRPLNMVFCAEADVPEAIIVTSGAGVFSESGFLESPATYRAGLSKNSPIIGSGFIEVTTGLWPSSKRTTMPPMQ